VQPSEKDIPLRSLVSICTFIISILHFTRHKWICRVFTRYLWVQDQTGIMLSEQSIGAKRKTKWDGVLSVIYVARTRSKDLEVREKQYRKSAVIAVVILAFALLVFIVANLVR
jgi:hypothetical protein